MTVYLDLALSAVIDLGPVDRAPEIGLRGVDPSGVGVHGNERHESHLQAIQRIALLIVTITAYRAALTTVVHMAEPVP
ncbi:hypothetical protein [Streptomyces sp. WZ-12]|uniref:hypothetical protein n=1 Tax=Streptomyces sp. WZ-12 TaxID=3030210 RepID=UPI002380D70E|nr:hypothetical protein [Streptomyces sp. WZ-12]